MKQQITEKDLLELENVAGLIHEIDKAEWNRSLEHIETSLKRPEAIYGYARSMTIGRMISYLGKDLKHMTPYHAGSKPRWHVGVPLIQDGRVKGEFNYMADELCDALWEAVKYKYMRVCNESR